MRRWTLGLTIAAVASMGFAACGDDGNGGGGDATTTTDTSTSTTTDTSTATTTDTSTTTTTDTSTTTTTDTSTTTVTDTTTQPDVGPVTCDDVTLSGNLTTDFERVPSYIAGDGETDLGFGGAGPDLVVVEFYTVDGDDTFDLTSSINSNFETCEQCVLVYADITENGATIMLHRAGSITVAGTPGEEELEIAFSGVEVEEVTIDGNTNVSTPVVGGICADIGDVTLETPPCVPSCGDSTVCGDDGCGGTCGDGCTTGSCSLDAMMCLEVADTFAFEGLLEALQGSSGPLDNQYGIGIDDPDGEEARGLLVVEFWLIEEGEIAGAGEFPTAPVDLAAAANNNYAYCETCIISYIVDGNGVERAFFPTAGTLTVNTADSNQTQMQLSLTLDNLTLTEVTVDSNTYVSTPVPGGLTITPGASVTISTATE